MSRLTTMLPWASLGIFVLTAVQGCKSNSKSAAVKDVPSAATAGKLSLNDVSILLPIPGNNKSKYPRPSDMPNPAQFAPGQRSAPLDNQPFLPAALLKQLEPVISENIKIYEKSSLKDLVNSAEVSEIFDDVRGHTAISMRIDPCVNILQVNGDDSRCVQQLRLMWQNGDNNIHAIYTITRDDLKDISNRLLQLQQQAGFDYSKEPLEIHPVIAKQGVDGSYYRGVLGIIHSYARGSRLTLLSALANNAGEDENTDFNWVMLTSVVQNGNLVKTAIPATGPGPDGKPAYVLRLDGEHDPDPAHLVEPSPGGTSSDALFPVNAKSAVTANIAHFEDPRRQDATTIDCGSCHNGLIVRATALQNGKPAINVGPGFTSDHWNLKNITDLSKMPLTSLQMFSYISTDDAGRVMTPVISQRTINETAVVADYLNSQYLGNGAASDQSAAGTDTGSTAASEGSSAAAADADNACGTSPHVTPGGYCYATVDGRSTRVKSNCCPN